MDSWIIGLIDILIVGLVFSLWFWIMRYRYGRDAKGKMICEFWRENKSRYFELLQIEPNGIEIRAPAGHIVPRYFINHEAVDIGKYPRDPILGLKILQVDVPLCSWVENNPEPINPRTRKTFITASLIATTNNEDFLAFAYASAQEIKELEEQLAKAYTQRLNKTVVYLLIIMSMVCSLGAAFLSYEILNKLTASGF